MGSTRRAIGACVVVLATTVSVAAADSAGSAPADGSGHHDVTVAPPRPVVAPLLPPITEHPVDPAVLAAQPERPASAAVQVIELQVIDPSEGPLPDR